MGKTRDNPYYYSFAEYCKNVFGRRLYRVALDAGFTCPHRDPGTGEGGCIFCSDAGSGEFSFDFHGQELTMDDIERILGAQAKREGKPGETKEMVFRTTEYLNDLKMSGIKIHLLHIIRGTRLHEIYEAQERNDGRSLEGEPLVRPLSFDEYTDTVCGCLERLSPEIVVHRLTGDCDKDSLVAPLWSLEKGKVINAIRHKMKERG